MSARLALPPTSSLLTQGGDERILLDARTALNKYGCGATPDPTMAAFGSSTATTVSSRGYAAADHLRRKVLSASAHLPAREIYAAELQGVREELRTLCELKDLPGVDIALGASGTDIHLMAAQLCVQSRQRAPLIIMMDATETGSGVAQALRGEHFNGRTAQGTRAVAGTPVSPEYRDTQLVQIPVRTLDGSPRALQEVHDDIETWMYRAALTLRDVLLVTLDVSKTGLLVPSPAFAASLLQRWPDTLTVMVDASQFRLSNSTLRSYLEAGFLVAVTGSKFLTGPSFCGALFIPPGCADRFRHSGAGQRALLPYCARADWPPGWAIRGNLKDRPNFGMLMRWRAALAELRALRRIPPEHIRHFLRIFGAAVTQRLDNCEAFERLPTDALIRLPRLQPSEWDQLPTIFPFLLYQGQKPGQRVPLNRVETQQAYLMMQRDLSRRLSAHPAHSGLKALARLRCQLGQPVACGVRQGVPVSAVRLSISARLIVEALSNRGAQAGEVIARALSVLDKAEWLAQGAPLPHEEHSHAAS